MEAEPKRRRGGINQRLAADAAEEAAARRPSALVELLLEEYAWGRLSPHNVQVIAMKSLNDLAYCDQDDKFPDLRALANLGSQGRHTQNISRDLLKYINSEMSLPPKTLADIPTKHGDRNSALMLPHEYFSYVYEKHPEQFTRLFVPGGDDQLKKIWHSAKHSDLLKDHDCIKNLVPERSVPIGIHGDEVQISWRGKCYCQQACVFSWFSFLASGAPTTESLLLIWACSPRQFISGLGGTIDCFMRILAWSLCILASGKWPSRDWRDVPYLW